MLRGERGLLARIIRFSGSTDFGPLPSPLNPTSSQIGVEFSNLPDWRRVEVDPSLCLYSQPTPAPMFVP
jgi:hypothetical protein